VLVYVQAAKRLPKEEHTSRLQRSQGGVQLTESTTPNRCCSS